MAWTLHCPHCRTPVERTADGFRCESGGFLSFRLGHALQRASLAAKEIAPEDESPKLADYLWCPNCTAPMEDYDDRVIRLHCPACELRLPTREQIALIEDKPYHPKLDDLMGS